ncbi:MAG: serine dehydratase subunit alpha family protein, partial [Muribaculaceae bacterium]|nr:serine dehydratase subunit alpha family protein [Muribaculaceae bacterium]
MMTAETQQKIIALLKREVVPAIGCTEPIAVALCVAKATELLGFRPECVQVRLSANILKNAMGVGIPGTGMVGLPIAIALGVLIGKSEYGLEVLRDCNRDAVEAGKAYIAENRITIALEEEDPDKLFIDVVVAAAGHEAQARIKTHHTHFVLLRRDSELLAAEGDTPAACADATTKPEADQVPLTLRMVYDFATLTPEDDLRFILEAKRLNEGAAQAGLRENYGHQLGKTMCSPLGRGIMGDSI